MPFYLNIGITLMSWINLLYGEITYIVPLVSSYALDRSVIGLLLFLYIDLIYIIGS